MSGSYDRGISLEERLRSFPTEELPLTAPVSVRWNQHHVPHIFAESDSDAAFALGLVHAHLRLNQIELMKRIAYGRLSEMAGPFAVELDHALRLLDLPAATAAMAASLPTETRIWLQRFCDGLNTFQERQPRRPPFSRLLALAAEMWTVRDILTLSRLAGADINWLIYISALSSPENSNHTALWPETFASGVAHFTSSPEALAAIIENAGRTGSNSLVVAPARSATGSALIANDPHLGLALPNFWILAGLHAPTLRAVGFMVPGLPFFGLGRTPHLAWGGTNMRAASSDLVDVSHLSADQISLASTRIRVRGFPTRRRPLRKTSFGPLISDAKFLRHLQPRQLALHWMGHSPSDEITAFLRAARARSCDEFRAAFETYAVSSQTLLVADSHGDIARVLAVTLPDQPRGFTSGPIVSAQDPRAEWRRFAQPTELPFLKNPGEGYIVSANDHIQGVATPLGFFFSNGERVQRIGALLRATESVTIDQLRAIQTDTLSPAAAQLARDLDRLAGRHPAVAAFPALAECLAKWDGNYTEDSVHAPIFEHFLSALTCFVHTRTSLTELPSIWKEWNYLVTYLPAKLSALTEEQQSAVLLQAVARVRKAHRANQRWGELHTVRVAHQLGSIPLIGRLFRLGDYSGAGSRETPMKSSHGMVTGRHTATYGSQARHISDLGDLDANTFVLFGGNDGWWGSDTFADQIELWREKRSIRMPLTRSVIETEFPVCTELRSSGRAHGGRA